MFFQSLNPILFNYNSTTIVSFFSKLNLSILLANVLSCLKPFSSYYKNDNAYLNIYLRITTYLYISISILIPFFVVKDIP